MNKSRFTTRWILFFGVALFLGRLPTAHADEVPNPMGCIDDIKQVCAGMEDHLEACSDQRGGQMSDKCRDLLKSAIQMAASPSGPGACMADIKVLCPQLVDQSLTQCIIAKKAYFSQACRDYLAAGMAKNPADNSSDR